MRRDVTGQGDAMDHNKKWRGWHIERAKTSELQETLDRLTAEGKEVHSILPPIDGRVEYVIVSHIPNSEYMGDITLT